MDKTSEIKQLWRDRFNDSRAWMSEVFTRIYRHGDDALTIATPDGDHVASMLLLRRESLSYQGEDLGMAYIYGAATARKLQGQGYMSRLVVNALEEARRRGDTIASLIPARGRLYGFYCRFGFTPAFFSQQQRYTAMHRFVYDDETLTVEQSTSDVDELAAAYNRLSAMTRSAFVSHTESDFKTILIDNSLEPGGMIAVARNSENGHIRAIGLAVADASEIAVTDIVADSHASECAVFASFAERAPGRMTVVNAYPSMPGVTIRRRGMARIVNVMKMFEAIARINPRLNMLLHVTDPILTANTGYYRIADGRVQYSATQPENLRVDLDADVTILTSILFSTPEMGEIFGLPTARPFISLMLS